jgi:hypothetical protein
MFYPNVQSLTNAFCTRNPTPNGRHELYEGSEKQEYICKYCGMKYRDLKALTNSTCLRHPVKGRKHEPAL